MQKYRNVIINNENAIVNNEESSSIKFKIRFDVIVIVNDLSDN